MSGLRRIAPTSAVVLLITIAFCANLQAQYVWELYGGVDPMPQRQYTPMHQAAPRYQAPFQYQVVPAYPPATVYDTPAPAWNPGSNPSVIDNQSFGQVIEGRVIEGTDLSGVGNGVLVPPAISPSGNNVAENAQSNVLRDDVALQEYRARTSALEAEIASLQKYIADLTAENQAAIANASQQQTNSATLSAEMDAALTASGERLAVAQARLEEAIQQARASEERARAAERRVNRIEAGARDSQVELQQRLTECEQLLQAERAQHASAMQVAQAQLAESDAVQADMEAAMRMQRAELDRLTQLLVETEARVQDHQEAMAAMEAKMQQMSTDQQAEEGSDQPRRRGRGRQRSESGESDSDAETDQESDNSSDEEKEGDGTDAQTQIERLETERDRQIDQITARITERYARQIERLDDSKDDYQANVNELEAKRGDQINSAVEKIRGRFQKKIDQLKRWLGDKSVISP